MSDLIQWDDPAIPASNYGIAINPTDFAAASTLRVSVTRQGVTVSDSLPVRYAPGALTIADQGPWVVDDEAVSVPVTPTGANLTFSNFTMTALPHLQIDATTGAITGVVDIGEFTEAPSGTATVTCQDQYGRTYSDTFAWSSQLRPQAVASGALADREFIVGTAVDVSTSHDFGPNGNTVTFTISGLPSGLVDDGDGTISGTPTGGGQSGTITVTATDEYGRTTTSAFNYTTQANFVDFSAEPDGTISILWEGTLNNIQVKAGAPFVGTYSTFHDGTPLDHTHLGNGVAGRALHITDTTGTFEVGYTLMAGQALVLSEYGQPAPSVSIQWRRNSVNIPDATGPMYTTTAEDDGTTVCASYVISAPGRVTVIENGQPCAVLSTTVDEIAPTLTSPTDAASGDTASTGSVSTSESGGVLYWVVTTSATAPSAAQVKLGQDNSGVAATASGSAPVTASGVRSISASGLTAETAYTTHFMHEDSAGNQSAIATASGFTTTAPSMDLLDDDFLTDTSADWTKISGDGTLVIADSMATATAGSPENNVAVRQAVVGLEANQDVDFTVGPGSTSSSIHMRSYYTDDDNYVRILFVNGTLQLCKRVGGVDTFNNRGGKSLAAGDIFRLRISSGTATILKSTDGGSSFFTEQTMNVSDVPFSTGVGFLVRNGAVQLDRITARNLA